MRSYPFTAPARPPAYAYSLPRPHLTPEAGGLYRPGPLERALADLENGERTSEDLVAASLKAAANLDPELNAFAYLDAEGAMAEAAACDLEALSGRRRGPLHGIPLTVKDVIDVAGMPTRAGSAAYEAVPEQDAAAVALLRGAGAIFLGKVTTHEFALGVTSPQSRNPHDPTRIPGGSSGGSAIAVATGMGLGSLGTDTRASIRVPAALCGTVGFKPTYGSTPPAGVVPLSWTMDHVAPMAASVGDAALLLDVLSPGRHIKAAAGAGVKKMRIGVPEAAFAGAEPAVAAAVRRAILLLEEAGAEVLTALRPTAADLDMANAAGMLVSRCEAATFHRNLGLDRSLYWDEVADQLEAAGGILAMDYLDAQRIRAELAAQMIDVFAGCEVLAMPAVPVVAPAVEDFSRHLLTLSRNAIPWSFTGLPAISVPCGTARSLPVGLQLVAASWREDLLVAAGTAVEAVCSAAS